MTLAARKADKRVHFGTPKQVFFNQEVESIIETGEIIQLSEILKAATRITPYVKCKPLFHNEDLSARFNSNFYLNRRGNGLVRVFNFPFTFKFVY